MELHHFFTAGINYKKTDASARGLFAVSQDQYVQILEEAKNKGIQEIFIVSTCNRTEIYGIALSAKQLSELLCEYTVGDYQVFNEQGYVKQGIEAVEHLFNVAGGLDSQILGDYEIVGQIKQAVKFAKENGCLGSFTERLFNTVLQSSKAIKNQTALSGGTVSVAFAAIQFLKGEVADIENKKIVLAGTGKIGRNTCKNLVDYLNNRNITIFNRTYERAKELAEELQLQSAPYEALQKKVEDADIVIVATNAEEPIIQSNDLKGLSNKVLIDLSIPNNIDPAARELPNITLANVDDLSKINDETLQRRMAEVPKAKSIIQTHIGEFVEWYRMRKHVPVIKAVKQTLLQMQYNSISNAQLEFASDNHEVIQKVVNNMAYKMRSTHTHGCTYIQAINEYIAAS